MVSTGRLVSSLAPQAKRSFGILLSILVVGAFVQFAIVYSTAADEPPRPRILGIANVHILVERLAASNAFYSKLLTEERPCRWCGQTGLSAYSVNEYQFIELFPIIRPYTKVSPPGNMIDEIVLATDDLPGMRRYLSARGVQITTPKVVELEPKAKDSKKPPLAAEPRPEQPFINTLDPERHRISFVQLPAEAFGAQSDLRRKRLIHAGFVVQDREAEDHFYKDILGFHVYWHGGMKDGEDNWVDMQVPDGTDWIEYMLRVPENASHKTLGVMNHIAIGVNDIEAAGYAARKNGVPG